MLLPEAVEIPTFGYVTPGGELTDTEMGASWLMTMRTQARTGKSSKDGGEIHKLNEGELATLVEGFTVKNEDGTDRTGTVAEAVALRDKEVRDLQEYLAKAKESGESVDSNIVSKAYDKINAINKLLNKTGIDVFSINPDTADTFKQEYAEVEAPTAVTPSSIIKDLTNIATTFELPNAQAFAESVPILTTSLAYGGTDTSAQGDTIAVDATSDVVTLPKDSAEYDATTELLPDTTDNIGYSPTAGGYLLTSGRPELPSDYVEGTTSVDTILHAATTAPLPTGTGRSETYTTPTLMHSESSKDIGVNILKDMSEDIKDIRDMVEMIVV